MKKLYGISFLIITILVFSTLAIATNENSENKAKEPLDKITFIHYKDGTVKEVGKAAKSPTCYKLMGVKWNKLPISYVIDLTNSRMSSSDVVSAITASTAEWDSHTSTILFDGYTIDKSATWDDTASEVDYKNEYVFDVYPDSKVIAVTNIWYTRYSRQIVDYDVLFNTYFTWGNADTNNDGTIDNPSVMDLQNIATHETGHGLGLADIYQNSCSTVTMYGYSGYGEIQKRTLEQPDITGLQKLY